MKNSFAFFLLVCFLACNIVCTKPGVDNTDPTESDSSSLLNKTIVYLIPKGAQYCTANSLVFTKNNRIHFTAVFDSSCIYTTEQTGNQIDINKLYGFSDCGTDHLKNSARIGWRWSDGALRLFGYVHNDGQILFEEITTAQIGSEIDCIITCEPNSYSFDIDGKTASIPRQCSGNYDRYRLFPYFGGDETAPHDIRITITELK
jgi:hypothetical protein